jgi:hypothetical protein
MKGVDPSSSAIIWDALGLPKPNLEGLDEPLLVEKVKEEVSLAHLVRKVEIQPNHPGSSPHGCRFGFLLLQKTKLL